MSVYRRAQRLAYVQEKRRIATQTSEQASGHTAEMREKSEEQREFLTAECEHAAIQFLHTDDNAWALYVESQSA